MPCSCRIHVYCLFVLCIFNEMCKKSYLVYVEFGTGASDSVTITNTWNAASLATAKSYNILARQIPCTATYK